MMYIQRALTRNNHISIIWVHDFQGNLQGLHKFLKEEIRSLKRVGVKWTKMQKQSKNARSLTTAALSRLTAHFPRGESQLTLARRRRGKTSGQTALLPSPDSLMIQRCWWLVLSRVCGAHGPGSLRFFFFTCVQYLRFACRKWRELRMIHRHFKCMVGAPSKSAVDLFNLLFRRFHKKDFCISYISVRICFFMHAYHGSTQNTPPSLPSPMLLCPRINAKQTKG